MKTKDKIEELEKRIRELEARPQYVPVYQPIYVQPAPMPYNPYVQPYTGPYISYCGGANGGHAS